MKKTGAAVLGMGLLILLAVSNFSSVSAALPPGTYTDHQNANGETIIDVADHPLILFDAFHYDSGAFGAGDVIRIWRYIDIWTPLGIVQRWLPVAIFTDINDRISLFDILYTGYPTSKQLINDPSTIEVCREGKSRNIHAVWKTDLVIPEEQWGPYPGHKTTVPEFTVPAGMLVFRGHGDAVSGEDPSTGSTFSQVITWTGYYGDATFVCPTWDFGGPVGVDEGTYPTRIRIDATVVTTVL